MTASAIAVLPAWARRTVYIGAGGFGAANLIVSSLSVGMLAHDHLQLGVIRAVALALGLDCGAIVAAALWVAAPVGHELRSWGRSVALGLVGASMVGNASEVLAKAGHVPPPALTLLALSLAVAAPLVSMLLAHLVLLVQAAVTTSVTPGWSSIELAVREEAAPLPVTESATAGAAQRDAVTPPVPHPVTAAATAAAPSVVEPSPVIVTPWRDVEPAVASSAAGVTSAAPAVADQDEDVEAESADERRKRLQRARAARSRASRRTQEAVA